MGQRLRSTASAAVHIGSFATTTSEKSPSHFAMDSSHVRFFTQKADMWIKRKHHEFGTWKSLPNPFASPSADVRLDVSMQNPSIPRECAPPYGPQMAAWLLPVRGSLPYYWLEMRYYLYCMFSVRKSPHRALQLCNWADCPRCHFEFSSMQQPGRWHFTNLHLCLVMNLSPYKIPCKIHVFRTSQVRNRGH